MESISAFDIFKIGVGPSSSHTMGPWRAAQRFVGACQGAGIFDELTRVEVELFGSLAKTGHGHGTDFAVTMGLAGEDPVACDPDALPGLLGEIRRRKRVRLAGAREVSFDPGVDVIFNKAVTLEYHPNAMTCRGWTGSGEAIERTYFSVGGGFIVEENGTSPDTSRAPLAHPFENSADLLRACAARGVSIPVVAMENERAWRSDPETRDGLLAIWRVMERCIYRGCHSEGVLPGGLGVSRRAGAMNRRMLAGARYETPSAWKEEVRASRRRFEDVIKWVSCFALAVNEENAAFGRVVTAPTNGAAGVIPAVMMYYDLFRESSPEGIVDFLLTAAQVGILFKKGATISAAMGGCQAEIGVSSAMAAAGLAHCVGGTPAQAMMAAEIAMEHHLGMTCDPIGGLVQVPCIERNTMGAIKAITAANIAIESDPDKARVSLDGVIRTMWETAKDMGSKYKETSEGGLAVNISVSVPEC